MKMVFLTDLRKHDRIVKSINQKKRSSWVLMRLFAKGS